MNRYAELKESQRQQIDLLIDSLYDVSTESLEAAHLRGIIHRRLKPANVKIGPGDASRREQEDIDEANTIY